ncbi:MAG: hypothetical protein ACKORE_09985 [Bacteroidota bacterium]
MDRLVDHVFVLDGSGGVKDIHGNYTEYRSQYDAALNEKTTPAKEQKPAVESTANTTAARRKLSFKEQKEMDTLEAEIPVLEQKKAELVAAMGSGLEHEALQRVSDEFRAIESKIDEKTMRWLELQELAGA